MDTTFFCGLCAVSTPAKGGETAFPCVIPGGSEAEQAARWELCAAAGSSGKRQTDKLQVIRTILQLQMEAYWNIA